MELILSYKKCNDKDNEVRMVIVSVSSDVKVKVRHALSFLE